MLGLGLYLSHTSQDEKTEIALMITDRRWAGTAALAMFFSIASLNGVADAQQGTAALPNPTAREAKPNDINSGQAGLSLTNAALTDVIDVLAREARISYTLDPKVQGSLILNTYGEIKALDPRSLLEKLLGINGYAMVKEGDLYRIVALADATHFSIDPERRSVVSDIRADDTVMLNLLFLKYASADEMLKIINPFLGDHAKAFTIPSANLLLVLDTRRNMRRVLELIGTFDDEALAHSRIRMFSIKNTRPSDFVGQLENVIKPVFAAANFVLPTLVPVDSINTVIAISPTDAVFPELEKWLRELDVKPRRVPDKVSTHIYRVKYGDAEDFARAVMSLYGTFMSPEGLTTHNGTSAGASQLGGTSSPNNPSVSAPNNLIPGSYNNIVPTGTNQFGGGAANASSPPSSDLTGRYLGSVGLGQQPNTPRVIAEKSINTILIQALPSDYENIRDVLESLDVPPRQVLIEAKIYEVDLTRGFSSSISATLQTAAAGAVNQFLGNLSGGTSNLSIGTLVGRSRQLLAAVQLEEAESRAKVISAPSVIATDSKSASINVGVTVPTLAAQAVTDVQQSGNSLFANSIVNQSSGVTLSITPHVTAGGIVTMEINQEVSSPIAPASTGIQSPSFANRSIETTVTIQDGDTIAIGGIIDEQSTYSTTGIPLLNRIPIIGAAFGSRSYNKERTELIIFITPKVIYDTNGITDATEELREQIKDATRLADRDEPR